MRVAAQDYGKNVADPQIAARKAGTLGIPEIAAIGKVDGVGELDQFRNAAADIKTLLAERTTAIRAQLDYAIMPLNSR